MWRAARSTLAYGANTIVVEVTAQAGNTRNYAVTVTRALPVVSMAERHETTCTEGSALELGFTVPSNDMAGTVTYAAGATHPASLADDLGSGRSTGFTMSVGDTSPSNIEVPIVDDALNEENETFTNHDRGGDGLHGGQSRHRDRHDHRQRFHRRRQGGWRWRRWCWATGS